MLEIKDLHVEVEGKKILNGLTLTVHDGERVALMGPNGSGKSTLAYTLMGHPKYVVTSGSITFNGKDVLAMEPDERSREGLFLSFQYPASISGVTLSNFLRQALISHGKRMSIPAFRKELTKEMEQLGINSAFADRYLNEGFSGGEKKRAEILQLSMLKPKLAILDETDSGLDIDAIRVVAEGVNKVHADNQHMSTLIITHYQRILHYLQPDTVHVLHQGKIIKSGKQELVEQLERKGYGWITGEL
jgi:Fe-S cluster assembly ATP-binding protein